MKLRNMDNYCDKNIKGMINISAVIVRFSLYLLFEEQIIDIKKGL